MQFPLFGLLFLTSVLADNILSSPSSKAGTTNWEASCTARRTCLCESVVGSGKRICTVWEYHTATDSLGNTFRHTPTTVGTNVPCPIYELECQIPDVDLSLDGAIRDEL